MVSKGPDDWLSSAPLATVTGSDGRFHIDHVPVGNYYTIGHFPGYENPLAGFDRNELASMSEETRKALADRLPIVTVDGKRSVSVSVRLEHAAAISGTVLYDDGSPAVGLFVELVRRDNRGRITEGTALWHVVSGIGGSGGETRTDDLGRYRIAGIPAGNYAVRTKLINATVLEFGGVGGAEHSLQLGRQEGNGLVVYSGDALRESRAKFTKVSDGEVVDGMDITIPLTGLHPVSGLVTALSDGRALSAGEVVLVWADDREELDKAEIRSDGSFSFTDVPEGRYVLKVAGVPKGYKETEMPLAVEGDVNGLVVMVPDRTSAQKTGQE